MRNEQQFQVTFTDESVRTIGADRYRIEAGVLIFFEEVGPATPDQAVASFPMEYVTAVVRTEPAVEYS